MAPAVSMLGKAANYTPPKPKTPTVVSPPLTAVVTPPHVVAPPPRSPASSTAQLVLPPAARSRSSSAEQITFGNRVQVGVADPRSRHADLRLAQSHVDPTIPVTRPLPVAPPTTTQRVRAAVEDEAATQSLHMAMAQHQADDDWLWLPIHGIGHHGYCGDGGAGGVGSTTGGGHGGAGSHDSGGAAASGGGSDGGCTGGTGKGKGGKGKGGKGKGKSTVKGKIGKNGGLAAGKRGD